MAAVQKDDVEFIMPPGYEQGDIGYCDDDEIETGDPIVISGNAPDGRWPCAVKKATGTEAHGFAVKNCKRGGTVEYMTQAEFDGFVGLTPGAALSVVDGEIDDDEPTVTDGETTVPGPVQIRAINASRIRVNVL